MPTRPEENEPVESGKRLCRRLTLGDLEANGGVIDGPDVLDDGCVDSGWDDTDSGEYLPCCAAFAK